MKWLVAVLVALLLMLQYRLWIGEGSIANVVSLEREIKKQRAQNQILIDRNERLAAEVRALREGDQAVEGKARNDLGLIKEGETFIMLIDGAEDSSTSKAPSKTK